MDASEFSSAFALLVLAPVAIAAWGVASGRRVYEFPVASSFLFIAWIIPQAIHIESAGVANGYDARIAWLYAVLCLGALTAGFYLNRTRRSRREARRMRFSRKRLTIAAAALVVAGSAATFMVIRTAESTSLTSQWTGVITAYVLLTNMTFYGVCLAVLLYLRKPSPELAAIILVGLIGTLPAILNGVKRHVIFEVALVLLGGWFFVKRQAPPRALVVVAVALGTVLLHQVGAIRRYVEDGRGSAVEAVFEGVPFERFEYLSSQRSFELQQAASDIYATNQTLRLEWGAEHWNKLVHQYVPAFLIGRDYKESAKLRTGQATDQWGVDRLESLGATRTGFSDSFRSFWVFGALVFAAIGCLFGGLYSRALSGELMAQFYYLILLDDGLIAITESTARFVAALPFLLAVTFAMFHFASVRVPSRRSRGRERKVARLDVRPQPS